MSRALAILIAYGRRRLCGALSLVLVIGFWGAAPAFSQATSGADTAYDPNKVFTHSDEFRLIAADLEKLTPERQKGTRYLTLTHLANACTRDRYMHPQPSLTAMVERLHPPAEQMDEIIEGDRKRFLDAMTRASTFRSGSAAALR